MRLKIFAFVVLCSVLASPVFSQTLNPFLAGFDVVVNERGMYLNATPNNNNWEPYMDALGDGTLLYSGNREETPGDTLGTEVGYLAMFNPDNSVALVNGFYTNVNLSNPWNTNNDTARADGNPPRVGGDRTPGGTKLFFGNECTPWAFPALFPAFSPGVTYTRQMGAVQFMQKTSPTTITPLGPVIDPTYTPGDTWAQTDQNRFGGDIRGLSNGGFVVQIDNRTTTYGPTGDRWLSAAIFDNNGTRVLGPFNANQVNPTSRTSGWSNLAAYNGGWANRPEEGGNIAGVTPTVQFWTNAGAPAGVWPITGNTSITNLGGSNTRINGNPGSNYVYMVGRGDGNTNVYLTKIDPLTQTTVDEVLVNDTFAATPDRCNLSVNANDEVFVCWSDHTINTTQMIGRLYDENLDPVTDAFYCFENSNVANFTSRRPSCAIADDGRILISGIFDGVGATGIPAYATTFGNDQLAVVIQIAEPPSDVDNWTLND